MRIKPSTQRIPCFGLNLLRLSHYPHKYGLDQDPFAVSDTHHGQVSQSAFLIAGDKKSVNPIL